MAYHATSGRDLSRSAFWPREPVAPPDDTAGPPLPETDLAELAAKFAASTGPGLSQDLAVDLALQMVLHQIAEQACVATASSGSAIALYYDGELVCRASHGLAAPPLGSRLDSGVGLSGECLRTGQIQLSNDVQTDLRVDFEVCSRLGAHSVVVLPLSRSGQMIGIFEVLSSRPSAFGERDIGLLEALADRILRNLDRAVESSAPPGGESPSSGSDRFLHPQLAEAGPAEVARRWTDMVTWALAIVVLICAGWLSWRVVQHLRSQKAAAQKLSAHSTPSAAVLNTSATTSTAGNDATDASGTNAGASSTQSSPRVDRSDTSSPTARTGPRAPNGSLRVYDNGREVFRMPPASRDAKGPTDTSVPDESLVQSPEVQSLAVLELPAKAAESDLIFRIEPEYPEDARRQGIQGAVVLEVHIRPDGSVGQMTVVSGEPVLADAAMAAVQQWRFKPRQVNGKPVEMQTTVTLKFRLPS
jgi:TonB family protein